MKIFLVESPIVVRLLQTHLNSQKMNQRQEQRLNHHKIGDEKYILDSDPPRYCYYIAFAFILGFKSFRTLLNREIGLSLIEEGTIW